MEKLIKIVKEQLSLIRIQNARIRVLMTILTRAGLTNNKEFNKMVNEVLEEEKNKKNT
jgi:hypothetical protein